MKIKVPIAIADAIKEGYSTQSKLEISKQSDINDVNLPLANFEKFFRLSFINDIISGHYDQVHLHT